MCPSKEIRAYQLENNFIKNNAFISCVWSWINFRYKKQITIRKEKYIKIFLNFLRSFEKILNLLRSTQVEQSLSEKELLY